MVDFSPTFDYTISRAVNASVAQSVEQGTENPRVGGSIPPGGTKKHAAVAHLVERHLAKVEVASSSLVSRSKKKTPVIDRRFLFVSRLEARKGVKQNSPVGCFVARVFRPTAPVGRSLAKSGLDGRILRLTVSTRPVQRLPEWKRLRRLESPAFLSFPLAHANAL